MLQSFWNESIFKQPSDGRSLSCHGTAWDFHDSQNFRILMCARLSQYDLLIANHEMGHIQYFMSYKHLPYLFQDGPNPGFHEGVADVTSLSVGKLHYNTV